MKSKIRAGVIGLGVGAHHAKTLSSHPNCELVSICDLESKKLSEVRSRIPSLKQTQKYTDIIFDEKIDLVCIASHDEYHYDQIISCLDNGKHVYVEKPICLTKEQLKNIKKKLLQYPNLHLSSNMVLRTCPLFINLKKKIKSNNLGEIYHLEADYLWGRKEKLISGWRKDANLYSIIHGAAVHMVDLIIWIIDQKPLSVQGLGNNIATANYQKKYNDFAVFLLKFKNNLTVKISAHGGCVHPHFHSMKVFGTRATFVHDSLGSVIIKSSNLNNNFISDKSDYPAKEKRHEALSSFINSLVKFNVKPLISVKDVFNTMSICLSAEKAVKSGTLVEIEYL